MFYKFESKCWREFSSGRPKIRNKGMITDILGPPCIIWLLGETRQQKSAFIKRLKVR